MANKVPSPIHITPSMWAEPTALLQISAWINNLEESVLHLRIGSAMSPNNLSTQLRHTLPMITSFLPSTKNPLLEPHFQTMLRLFRTYYSGSKNCRERTYFGKRSTKG